MLQKKRGRIVIAGDIPGITVTATALTADLNLQREDWEAAFERVARAEGSASWWLGDLVVIAGTRYGSTYVRALKQTRYSPGHLRNLRSVANRVAPDRRLPAEVLSWSHHAVAARLEPDQQVGWLARAAAEGWTTKELSRALREPPGGPPPEFPDAERTDGRCPACGREYGP
jgi:hypothetical protein